MHTSEIGERLVVLFIEANSNAVRIFSRASDQATPIGSWAPVSITGLFNPSNK